MKDFVCQNCGRELFGRIDKKYCSDQCRSTFYHNNHYQKGSLVKEVNRILSKNRRILMDLNPDGKVKLKKADLLVKGFNFDYFTNVFLTKSGNEYKFCYGYGYILLDDDWVTLVKKQEYVK